MGTTIEKNISTRTGNTSTSSSSSPSPSSNSTLPTNISSTSTSRLTVTPLLPSFRSSKVPLSASERATSNKKSNSTASAKRRRTGGKSMFRSTNRSHPSRHRQRLGGFGDKSQRPCYKKIGNVPHDENVCPYAHVFETCYVCNCYLVGPHGIIATHIRGRQHREKLIAMTLLETVQVESQSKTWYCDVCVAEFSSEALLTAHKALLSHRKKLHVYEYQQRIKIEESDKFNVSVTASEDLDCGVVELFSHQDDFQIVIRNKSANEKVNFLHLDAEVPRYSQDVFQIQAAGFVGIPPGSSLSINISASTNVIGIHRGVLNLKFKGTSMTPQFTIRREVRITVGDAATMASLLPTSTYRPIRKKFVPSMDTTSNTIKGEKVLFDPSAHIWQPGIFQLPKDILDFVTNNSDTVHSFKVFKSQFLPLVTDIESLNKYQHMLLWLEECQMTVDIRRYDIKSALLIGRIGASSSKTRSGKLLTYQLDIAGLAEKRPSVRYGDIVKLKRNNEDTCYLAYAVDIRHNNILLQVNRQFEESHLPDMKYDIEFTFSRIPMQRMHQAIDKMLILRNISYIYHKYILHNEKLPGDIRDDVHFQQLLDHFTKLRSKEEEKTKELKWYNRNVAQNTSQQEAVKAIVSGRFSPLPYVVFGPPGTGKTITIVEAITQIAKLDNSARILVTCPSNEACDVILDRLRDLFGPSAMYRMNAMNRSRLVPLSKNIIKYTSSDASNAYYTIHDPLLLRKFKIIVTTCSLSGHFQEVSPPLKFTHIFVDEAAQAMENEIGITAQNAGPDSKIILAGDHKQLGPTVRSIIAKKLGLRTSLLEKWMSILLSFVYIPTSAEEVEPNITEILRELYPDIGNIAKRLYTQLVYNYRSHSGILELPNKLFYHTSLVPKADRMVVEQYAHYKDLELTGYPVVFMNFEGEDMREGDSPSWFNPTEVVQVKRIVEMLRKSKIQCSDTDIGVISPFYRQVLKIQTALKPAYSNVKVGTVEAFQGQEAKIIIISTVRSSEQYIDIDRTLQQGVLSHPKRFNVAITRAKALLIIVGKADILWTDPYWRELMELCIKNNTMRHWDGPSRNTAIKHQVIGAIAEPSQLKGHHIVSNTEPLKTTASASSSGSSSGQFSYPSSTYSVVENSGTSKDSNRKLMANEEDDDFEMILFESLMSNDVEWVDRE